MEQEKIIKVGYCTKTKNKVLKQYDPHNTDEEKDWLCLHNNTVEEDLKAVEEFEKKQNNRIMKRYWLFEQQQYYPNGGMLDFVGDFDTVEEAEDARTVKFNRHVPDTNKFRERDTGYHILDTQERKITGGWDQYAKKIIEETPLNKFE